MNILLINHYAGSPNYGMEFRPYYLAKGWVKAGHKVLIVGGCFSHLRKKQPKPGFENIDGLDYVWFKTNTYKGNGIGRLYSMFMFVWQLYRHRKLFRKFQPDAVIASSTYPLDIYPARRIARDNHAQLVFEIHDLWPLSPRELGGMSKYHPFIMIMQRAENYAYRYCDKCVSILPCVHEYVEKQGLNLSKLHIIPNGVVLEDWNISYSLPVEHQSLLSDLKEQGYFLMGFAGAHGIANALQTPIDGVKCLDKEKIALILVGEGQEKSKLIDYVKENNITNVFFLPAIPKYSIPTFLKMMDVLYIGLQNQSLFRFGISPNKIFDYMMAKKPIIQSIKAGNDMIAEAQCGMTIEPTDSEAVTEAILKLKKLPLIERQFLGERGFKYVIENHLYDVLINRFLLAIKDRQIESK